jgi:hypothetical protein
VKKLTSLNYDNLKKYYVNLEAAFLCVCRLPALLMANSLIGKLFRKSFGLKTSLLCVAPFTLSNTSKKAPAGRNFKFHNNILWCGFEPFWTKFLDNEIYPTFFHMIWPWKQLKWVHTPSLNYNNSSHS